MSDKFTIIIPSHNRHHYFGRLFDYYQEWPVEIILIDSTAERYRDKMPDNIEYIHSPGSTFSEKIVKASDFARTPYVALCADDDVLILDGVRGCVSALDELGASICAGQIKRYYPNEYGNAQYAAKSPQKDLIYKDNMSDKRFLSEYQLVLWSTYRVDFIKKAFAFIVTLDNYNHNFIELVLGYLGQETDGVIIKGIPFIKREISEQTLSWGQVTPPLHYMERENFEFELAKIDTAIIERMRLSNFKFDARGYMDAFRPKYCEIRALLFRSKFYPFFRWILGTKEVKGMSRETWI